MCGGGAVWRDVRASVPELVERISRKRLLVQSKVIVLEREGGFGSHRDSHLTKQPVLVKTTSAARVCHYHTAFSSWRIDIPPPYIIAITASTTANSRKEAAG